MVKLNEFQPVIEKALTDANNPDAIRAVYGPDMTDADIETVREEIIPMMEDVVNGFRARREALINVVSSTKEMVIEDNLFVIMNEELEPLLLILKHGGADLEAGLCDLCPAKDCSDRDPITVHPIIDTEKVVLGYATLVDTPEGENAIVYLNDHDKFIKFYQAMDATAMLVQMLGMGGQQIPQG